MTQNEVDPGNPQIAGSSALASSLAHAQTAGGSAAAAVALEARSPCSTSMDSQQTAPLAQRMPAVDPLQVMRPPTDAPAADDLPQPSGMTMGYQPPTAAPAVPTSKRGSGTGSPLPVHFMAW